MDQPNPKAIFLNAPFDTSYEPLFVTLLATLVCLGLEPHCVLEIRETGEGRLARIIQLMSACRMSIHDLSRTSTPVRFNMPFELGIASAIRNLYPDWYEILVLDSKSYRLDRTISDYKGRDPLIHNGTSEGMVNCLLDAFESGNNDIAAVRRAAAELRASAKLIKQQLKSRSVFRPAIFRLLVGAAAEIAIERGFIARS